MLFLFFFHSFEYEFIEKEEIPECSANYYVSFFKSDVFKKRIPPKTSFCIKGNETKYYKGQLSFIFNELDGVSPFVYFVNHEENRWIKLTGNSTSGAASTGIFRGFLYLNNTCNTTANVNIAFTTFGNKCSSIYLTNEASTKLSMISKPKGNTHCFFCGLATGYKLELHGDSELFGCKALVFPKISRFIDLKNTTLSFNSINNEVQSVVFKCHKNCISKENKIVIKGKKPKYAVEAIVDPLLPDIYQRKSEPSIFRNVWFILGMCIIGYGFIILLMFACMSECFTDCCCDDCCSCCGKCTCTCNMIPNKYKVNIIEDYSYSDDNLPDIPEYKPEFSYSSDEEINSPEIRHRTFIKKDE